MPPMKPVTSVPRSEGDECPSADAEPQRSCLVVDVIRESGDWGELDRFSSAARAVADAITAELGPGECSACVALCSDAQVAELNGTYRGKPTPTNVLSFAAGGQRPDADSGRRFLGDVLLARETLVREATESGVPVEHHFQHLVAHGLLHVLGYDHQTDAQAEDMEALEVRVLARVGVPNPYERLSEITERANSL